MYIYIIYCVQEFLTLRRRTTDVFRPRWRQYDHTIIPGIIMVYNILYIVYILRFTTDGRAIHRKTTNQTGCSGGNDVGRSALYHIMTRVYIYLIVLRYLRARSHRHHTSTRQHSHNVRKMYTII